MLNISKELHDIYFDVTGSDLHSEIGATIISASLLANTILAWLLLQLMPASPLLPPKCARQCLQEKTVDYRCLAENSNVFVFIGTGLSLLCLQERQ